MGKRLGRDITKSLAPNPDLRGEDEQDQEQKPGASDYVKEYFSPVVDYIQKQAQERKNQQDASVAAMQDRFKMMKNPELQGPTLPISVQTPAESAQLDSNMALAAGTIGNAPKSYMKNYLTPEAVEGAIAKGEGIVPKISQAIDELPSVKTYSQEKLNQARDLIDKIIKSPTIHPQDKAQALQKFKTLEHMHKVRGFE